MARNRTKYAKVRVKVGPDDIKARLDPDRFWLLEHKDGLDFAIIGMEENAKLQLAFSSPIKLQRLDEDDLSSVDEDELPTLQRPVGMWKGGPVINMIDDEVKLIGILTKTILQDGIDTFLPVNRIVDYLEREGISDNPWIWPAYSIETPQELYDKASRCQKKDRLPKPFQLFRAAAHREHSDAFFDVADCYHHGRGTARDSDRAIAWYCRDILDPNALDKHVSQYEIAKLLYERPGERIGQKAFELLSEVRDSELDWDTDKGESNCAVAFNFFSDVAKKLKSTEDDLRGPVEYWLGRCYDEGKGIPKQQPQNGRSAREVPTRRAVRHFEEAVRLGGARQDLATRLRKAKKRVEQRQLERRRRRYQKGLSERGQTGLKVGLFSTVALGGVTLVFPPAGLVTAYAMYATTTITVGSGMIANWKVQK